MPAFFRLNNEEGIQTKGPVIKKDDFVAWVEADAIVAEARDKAEAILAKAQKAYEDQLKSGYEEGFQKGAKAAEESAAKVHKRFAEEYRGEISKVHQSIPILVTQAVDKLFGELPDQLLLQKVIAQTLKHHALKGDVTIHVSPKDFSNMMKNLGQLEDANKSIDKLQIEQDRALGPGEFKFDSEGAIINSSAASQLESLKEAISGNHQKGQSVVGNYV